MKSHCPETTWTPSLLPSELAPRSLGSPLATHLPLPPSVAPRSSAAEETLYAPLRLPYTTAASSLLVELSIDACGSRPWLATVREKRAMLLKQDTELPSDEIRVSASTQIRSTSNLH